MKQLVLASLFLVGGAAATNAETIHSTDIYLKYTLQDASVFAAAGGPTEVYGAPTNGASAEEVVASLRLPSYLAQSSMKLTPQGSDGYRMALVFAPQAGLSGPSVCKGKAKGGTAGSRTQVLAVFCRGETAILSEARLEASGAFTPGGQEFGAGMRRLIRTILPLRSPFDQGERGCRRRGC